MTDRPILFSAPMVQAILAGTKTQTRRALKFQPSPGISIIRKTIRLLDAEPYHSFERRSVYGNYAGELDVKIKRQDRLWVRETHQFRGGDYGDSGGEIEWYRCYGSDGAPDNWDPEFPSDFEPTLADNVQEITDAGDKEEGVIGYVTKRRPGIHMPRWASRLTLLVTDVRVERLKDISRADALAEGIVQYGRFYGLPDTDWDDAELTAEGAYFRLWDRINGAGAADLNPWCVAYTFSVIKQNIDQTGRAAA